MRSSDSYGSSPVGETTRSARWVERFAAACAATLGALLYWNALDNPFVYDDYRLIVDNPYLQDPPNFLRAVLREITRPLVTASYVLDTVVWGREPFGYHLTSVLLHAWNVVLVYRLALLAGSDRRLQKEQFVGGSQSPPVAAIATAALFAVHPMMTEAVGYITGRADVACASLFLLAFLAGRRWLLGGQQRWRVACLGLWLAALLAKETAVMLPFALMAYDWFVLDHPPAERRGRFVAMALPMAAFAVTAVVARVAVLLLVERGVSAFDWRFGVVAAEALWRHLLLFSTLTHQALYHAVVLPAEGGLPRMIAVVLGIVLVPVAAWRLRRVHSLMAFGGLWFVLMLLPSAGLFSLGIGEPLAERRGYLAAAGLFLVCGSAFSLLWERTSERKFLRATVLAVALVYVAQLSILTLVRNEIWGSPVLLAAESVALAPDEWVPWMLLGEAFRQDGNCDDGARAFRKVLVLRPREVAAYSRLRTCLIEQQRFEEAESLMLQLETVDPRSADAAVTLGLLSVLANNPERARTHLSQAIERDAGVRLAPELLALVDGILDPDENRQLCEELASMSASFDLAACLARSPGPAGVNAPSMPPGT